MITKNRLFLVLIYQIFISLLFSFLIKNINFSECVSIFEKYLPYYLSNPKACGSNSHYVVLYYFAAFFSVLFLFFKEISAFEKPTITAKLLFFMINFLTCASLLAWLLGAEVRKFPSLNSIHEGQLFWPTVVLAGSTIWIYLSIIFLIKERKE